MEKVYLVYYEDPYDNDEDVRAVFSTYEKAEAFINKEASGDAGYDDEDNDEDDVENFYKKHYRIEEWNIDKGI